MSDGILVEDAQRTDLARPDGTFRRAAPGNRGPSPLDPDAQRVVEAGGAVVAADGFLTHDDPRYADLCLAVRQEAPRLGPLTARRS